MHASSVLSRCRLTTAQSAPCTSKKSYARCRTAAKSALYANAPVESSSFAFQPGYFADRHPVSDLGWPTNFREHYVKGKLIGTGSFGTVYLGIDLHTGQEVAVKVMPKIRGKLTKERTLQKLTKEVHVMELLQDCPNVIQLAGCYEDQDDVYVVTEMCSGGDLQRLSDECGAFSEPNLAIVAQEVLKVIGACHDSGIVHGDIKPANFCIKSRQRCPLVSPEVPAGGSWLKAIDFGCSQVLDGHPRFAKRTGTPVYMAPEVFERDYSIEADMWSLGVMLYQLYSRRFPWWDTCSGCRATNIEEVMAAVLDGDIPFDYGCWLHMSMEGRDFIKGCLCRDEEDRLTVTQAMHHPWFQRMMQKSAVPSSNNIVPRSALVRERQAVA